jgi:hypothetical protein
MQSKCTAELESKSSNPHSCPHFVELASLYMADETDTSLRMILRTVESLKTHVLLDDRAIHVQKYDKISSRRSRLGERRVAAGISVYLGQLCKVCGTRLLQLCWLMHMYSMYSAMALMSQTPT